MKPFVLLVAFVFICPSCAKEAAFHRQYRDLISRASSDAERRTRQFEYRLLCLAENGALAKDFTTQDGVDEFEAWMLASIYLHENFGACCDLALPERREATWIVRTAIDLPSREG